MFPKALNRLQDASIFLYFKSKYYMQQYLFYVKFCIYYRYMPVRSDSVVGELKLSGPTETIFPGKL